MRQLTKKETMSVAGGLIPPGGGGGSGGGGTGGGGSGGSGGGSSTNVLSNYTIQQDVNDSSTLSAAANAILGGGGTITYYANPAAAAGSSSISGNHIYIAPQYEGNVNASLGQLAHELGHYENPVDTLPQDYASANAYASTMETNEGAAQLFAIRAIEQLANLGINVPIPGDPSHVQQELDVIKNNPGASDAVLAQKIGAVMATQVLSNGQTYDQFYHAAWNAHASAGGTINVSADVDANEGQYVAVTSGDSIVFPTVTVGGDEYD